MLPLKKILWPTDFSEPSYVALEAAKELARKYDATIYALHVMGNPPLMPDPTIGPAHYDPVKFMEKVEETAQKSMREVVDKKIGKGIKVKQVLVTGDEADEIIKLTDKEDLDMIVIATHGRTGWKHLIFGSVAEKVVRLSPVPVLTIRKPREKED